MLKITCDTCRETVVVNMYTSHPAINFCKDAFNLKLAYSAKAKGRAICPKCGAEIVKHFESEITPSDIIDLALRREIHI
jgi:hypothetical protein